MAAGEPFRLVYRSFARVEFDPVKNVRVSLERGFGLDFVSLLFPGFVLESPDLRRYNELRYRVIGDVRGEILTAVYTVRAENTCRLITAWRGGTAERRLWDGRKI